MTWDKDETGAYVPRPLPRGFWLMLSVMGAVVLGLAIWWRVYGGLVETADRAQLGLAAEQASLRITSWDDGDSGDFSDGTEFRLSSVDAPEVGGVGAAVGGAECLEEREAGLAAKAFMERLTRDKEVRFEPLPDVRDRYGRYIGHLFVGDDDVIALGLAEGHLRPWPHDGSRQLAPAPNWCES